MAQWSENFISADFGELQANAMAVDCLGNWAVLAGRRVLTLVDLEQPQEKCHRLTRQSKWDIGCVQWNPHASHAHLYSTACLQRLDLYSWKNTSSTPVCSMKAHSRHISDIDWSPFDVNVIASCSVDSYTHLWDVRDPKKPTHSFQSVAGASQVKWNKVTNNCFATSHEGDVRIWDPRKGSIPVVYLTAHLAKIHGLDWSPTNEHFFATSSDDCSVKFWDYTNSRHNKGMLNSGSPVWRARFTPFGHGLVTVVWSTLRRGSENSIYLWNNDIKDQPVHQFIGHSDVVLEFQWRKKDEASRDYHLVTWSRDQSLRIWKVDSQLQRLCGYDAQDSSENEFSAAESIDIVAPKLESHSKPDEPSIDQSEVMSHQQRMSLLQEFSLFNKHIPNVTIEKMDASRRSCTVSVNSAKHSVTLTLNFPTNYPHNAAPSFDISASSGIGVVITKKLHKVLLETSQKHVKRNVNCLEPCLRQFAAAFETLTVEERKTPDSDAFPLPQPTTKLQHSFMQVPNFPFQDYTIPFPRTCGARFGSTGLLVCFGRSREVNKGWGGGMEKTPKALSELAAYSSTNRVRSSQSSNAFTPMFSRSPPTQKSEPVSVSMYYMSKQRPRTKSGYRNLKEVQHESKLKANEKSYKKEKKSVKLDPVRIFDVHCLLNVHRSLGENYRLDIENPEKMCQHNAGAALSVGRKDLVQLWSIVEIMSSPTLKPSSDPDEGPPWGKHPFGRQTLESLMDYYRQKHDVQTLAMLCCVFWNRQQIIPQGLNHSTSKTSLEYVPPNYNPYHTVSSMSGLLRSFTNMRRSAVENAEPKRQAMMKVRRSNSWSYEDFSFDDQFKVDGDPKEKAAEMERKDHENLSRLLDPKLYIQYDQYLKAYADILYRWALIDQSAQILKHITVPPEPHAGIEFGVQCHYCKADVRGFKCGTCKMAAFQCVVCHMGVKGASNFCLYCGHGGHTSHMTEWFKSEDQCPTGCGCRCLMYNPF